jgi:hypothetical protein
MEGLEMKLFVHMRRKLFLAAVPAVVVAFITSANPVEGAGPAAAGAGPVAVDVAVPQPDPSVMGG